MASGGKRGGAGDRVLESRHLVGLFLGVVLLCGVFFTLGYVMGHNQYGGSVHAESLTRPAHVPLTAVDPPTTSTPTASQPAPSDWDFYKKTVDNHIEPAAPAVKPEPEAEPVTAPKTSAATKPRGEVRPAALNPKAARESIVLQVAALRHQSDALAMAEQLQKKRFPSFVSAPAGKDALYRVQVGPYADERAADSAKTALDHAGFKAIIKR